MIKKAMINKNNQVVFVGEWDYGKMMINGEEVLTNPIPENHVYAEYNIEWDESEKRWKLTSETTDKERIRQLEDMLIAILEVI